MINKLYIGILMLLLMVGSAYASGCVYNVASDVGLVSIDKNCTNSTLNINVEDDTSIRVWQSIDLGMIGYNTYIELKPISYTTTGTYTTESTSDIKISRYTLTSDVPIVVPVEDIIINTTVNASVTNTTTLTDCNGRYNSYPEYIRPFMIKYWCNYTGNPRGSSSGGHMPILPPNGGAS